MSRRAVEVWADWLELGQPARLGTLFATAVRATESFEFAYDPEWLKSGRGQVLDPELQLYGGPQYPNQKQNFGVFLDSAPDRWGRFLQDRRERQTAQDEGRAAKRLRESDYLLGVYDEHRMGGLRFRLEPDGPFLDNNRDYASPPWTSLRELEQASLHLEREGASAEPNYRRWLRMLIAPGGSLGGARPKASVVDESGHLWIAKFPSRSDRWDGGGWELVAHSLAEKSGITVPAAQARRFNTPQHSFLTKRFDRRPDGGRIHYASALTMLGRSDGDDHTNGASYLELAELLIQHGSRTNADLEQLWRRIVFNVCISNVDDHLRNHGFLLTPSGWMLSPAFDMNPDPDGDGLKLNISEVDNAQELDLALDVAHYFRLPSLQAQRIAAEVVDVVSTWRSEAAAKGLGRPEIERMEEAFRVVKRAP